MNIPITTAICPESERPSKKRRVHFSEVSHCRFFEASISEGVDTIEGVISKTTTEQTLLLDKGTCEVHPQLNGVSAESNLSFDACDCALQTKQVDGPCQTTLAIENLVLLYFKQSNRQKKHPSDPSIDEPKDTTRNATSGSEHAAKLHTLPVHEGLIRLIDRIESRGRAALLPSTVVLRPQHLPLLRNLTAAVAAFLLKPPAPGWRTTDASTTTTTTTTTLAAARAAPSAALGCAALVRAAEQAAADGLLLLCAAACNQPPPAACPCVLVEE